MIVRRALSTYIAGYIGLAEMQIELIGTLASHCDDQQKLLTDAAMLQPLIFSAEKAAPS